MKDLGEHAIFIISAAENKDRMLAQIFHNVFRSRWTNMTKSVSRRCGNRQITFSQKFLRDRMIITDSGHLPNPYPLVTESGIFLIAGPTIVKGPGQYLFAKIINISFCSLFSTRRSRAFSQNGRMHN